MKYIKLIIMSIIICFISYISSLFLSTILVCGDSVVDSYHAMTRSLILILIAIVTFCTRLIIMEIKNVTK